MGQLEAFPLKILNHHPFRHKGTAHAIGRALCEDGNYYIVKANTPLEGDICATEWVGNSIADSLKLPTATVEILQMKDGELVIGSLEIRPRLADIEVSQFLTGRTMNDLFVPRLVESLSSAYALDLAIGNADRHECNFVIQVDGQDETAQRYGTLSVIDFSSADILNPTKRPMPFPRESNTRRAGRLIRAAHGFVQDSAQETLSRLSEGRGFILDRALIGLPKEWLPESGRDYLRNWMLGSSFTDRLERIESGLKNGSYL